MRKKAAACGPGLASATLACSARDRDDRVAQDHDAPDPTGGLRLHGVLNELVDLNRPLVGCSESHRLSGVRERCLQPQGVSKIVIHPLVPPGLSHCS